MKKILFLHGFFASGNCVPALTIKEAFCNKQTYEGKIEVLTPDLPLHPKEALEFIHNLCDREKPDLLVGNSCGAFLAQIIAPVVGIPALLGNPHLQMSQFLKERIGTHQYNSPRNDGQQEFSITQELIDEFAQIEAHQFDYTSPYYSDKVWGLFGDKDTLAHFEPQFIKYYNQSFHFPGAHTPTKDEVREWYVPIIEKMLQTFHKSEDGCRYFQHFKGGKYKLIGTAFDSETKERMVVYQALYGEMSYWIRPEKMFFEKVTRNGKTFNRFTEIYR